MTAFEPHHRLERYWKPIDVFPQRRFCHAYINGYISGGSFLGRTNLRLSAGTVIVLCGCRSRDPG